ncbi:MAG: amidohydrolase family protein [Nevskiales bacterium]|nr:amidohydrolase family protein [Nevskiales bacterium]
MLIRDAEIAFDGATVDLRVDAGRIVEIAPALRRLAGEPVIEARGRALIRSLRDHHLHLCAAAAARASVPCGPPAVDTPDALSAALRDADAAAPPGQWLRGVGYHDSVLSGTDPDAGLDRDWLDRCVPSRPLRLQHRSGRLWILNTAALRALGVDPESAADDPLERRNGRATGRLYDADAWLRARLPSQRPHLRTLSRALWRHGITAVTDTSHDNGLEAAAHFASAQAAGELLQDVRVMGDAELDAMADAVGAHGHRLWRGAHKFHLHDHALPEFGELCTQIRRAHAAGRNVAFHCVSRTDLVYALAALREAGTRRGDRIEHASIAPPELVEAVAELGLCVVTQPGFVAERGEAYRREVDADDLPWLYRLRAWLDAGVDLAGSSDAPYVDPNPWRSMQAAVDRRSAGGHCIGPDERLDPLTALRLWQGELHAPGHVPALRVGADADLCLLPAPWAGLCGRLDQVEPLLTLKRGRDAASDEVPTAAALRA